MTIRRVDDMFGNPVEYSAAWSFSGHEARSNAEKDELARSALESHGKQVVLELRARGNAIEFDHVQLTQNKDQRSTTRKNPVTGERTHNSSGTGVGHLFVKV